MHNRVALNEY